MTLNIFRPQIEKLHIELGDIIWVRVSRDNLSRVMGKYLGTDIPFIITPDGLELNVLTDEEAQRLTELLAKRRARKEAQFNAVQGA